jgi:hypothetical protein
MTPYFDSSAPLTGEEIKRLKAALHEERKAVLDENK